MVELLRQAERARGDVGSAGEEERSLPRAPALDRGGHPHRAGRGARPLAMLAFKRTDERFGTGLCRRGRPIV